VLGVTRGGHNGARAVQEIFEQVEIWTVVADVKACGSDVDLGEISVGCTSTVIEALLPLCLGDPGAANDFTIHKAALVCVDAYIPLIGGVAMEMAGAAQQFLADADRWQSRNAAVMLLAGAMAVEGSQALVLEALAMVASIAQDEVGEIRHSVLYALSKIAQHHGEFVVTQQHVLDGCMALILGGTRDPEPQNAAMACWAATNLANAAKEETREDGVSALSRYYTQLCESLVHVTSRHDVMESNLLATAHNALTELLILTPPECMEAAAALGSEMVSLLHTLNGNAYTGELSDADWAVLRERQCGVIPSIGELARVLPKETLLPAIETVMEQLWAALEYGRPQADADIATDDVVASVAALSLKGESMSNHSLVVESVLVALPAIVEALEGDYTRFAPPFNPHLKVAILSVDTGRVSVYAAGVVGDIARALGTDFAPFLDDFMPTIFEALRAEHCPPSAQAALMASIGDIACAVKTPFNKYFMEAAHVLMAASHSAVQKTVEMDDLDEVAAILAIRGGCLDGIVGVFQSCDTGESDAAAFSEFKQMAGEFTPMVLVFLHEVIEDEPDDALINSTAGLLGDIISVFGPEVVVGQTEFVSRIVDLTSASGLLSTKATGQWLLRKFKC
jgi:importin subunit beta-1